MIVVWQCGCESGDELSTLAGKLVRLRFELSDADLYSIRFRE